MTADAIPPDYTWPGFEALPEPLRDAHRRFFQAMAQRRPFTLREYRRAFRTLYDFLQDEQVGNLTALTTPQLEAFQQWCYRRHHWAPGNLAACLRTLRRIGAVLQELGVLTSNPFGQASLVTPHVPSSAAAQPLSWFRAIRRFMSWLRAQRMTPPTRGSYLQAFRHFHAYLAIAGACVPTELTPTHVEQFRVFLIKHPGRNRRPLSPLMQRLTVERLERFIHWLIQEGFLKATAFKQSGGRTARLKTVVAEFLAYGRMRMAAGTQRQYLRHLQYFQDWLAQRPKGQRVRNIVDVTVDVLTEYQRWLNTQATQTDGTPLSQSEKEARLYTLKAFLHFCYRKDFLPQDLRPFLLVPRREHKVPKRLLTDQEMAQLLDAPSETTTIGIRDRAMLELAYSGLRSAELLTLNVAEVQLEENRVFIRQAKGQKDRVVPMTSAARYWIGRWLRRRREFYQETDPETCFISKHARPLTPRHFAVTLQRHARRARLPMAVAPHDLRRITATHLAERGAPLRFIQALLGHTSLKVTTRYLRLSDAHIKREYIRSHPSNRRDHHLTVAA